MHRIDARQRMTEIIQSGNTPTGVYVMSTDATMTAAMGTAGFDFVVIDREHGPNDIQSTLGHIRAAEANGLVPMVRVLRNDSAEIQATLDVGAQAIIVPKISTRADAERALDASRYKPGGRGMCPAVEAARWTNDWPTYRDEANSNVLLIPLIETVEGVQNLREIAAVDGIDFAFFGFVDLALDMGIDPEDSARLDAVWNECVEVMTELGVQPGCNFGRGRPGATWGTVSSDFRILTGAAQSASQPRRGPGASPTAPAIRQFPLPK